MTSNEIEIIRLSWAKIAAHPQSMMRFYDILFEDAPEVRHFFPKDLSRQSEKLASTIGFAVTNLDRIEEIIPAIEDLGRIHDGYGVRPAHYDLVIEALMKTMKEALKDEFTTELEKTWRSLLKTISNVMMNAPKEKPKKMNKLLAKLFGRLSA